LPFGNRTECSAPSGSSNKIELTSQGMRHVCIYPWVLSFPRTDKGRGGWGGGQVSTYRAKNNKCRSLPPALPLHTSTRAWLTSVHNPPYAKQHLIHLMFMFPCYYAALSTCYEDNCIAYHSYVIERQWFLGWPYPVSAFGVFYHVCLQQAVCGMPPCTSRPFCAE